MTNLEARTAAAVMPRGVADARWWYKAAATEVRMAAHFVDAKHPNALEWAARVGLSLRMTERPADRDSLGRMWRIATGQIA